MARKKRKKNDTGFGARIARSIAAIIILTAFILSISYFVKEISTFDAVKFAKMTNPIFSKVGLNGDDMMKLTGIVLGRVGSAGIADKNSGFETAAAEDGDVAGVSALSSGNVRFKVAIMADSHDSSDLLKKALVQSETLGVRAVFHLGDLTDLGYLNKLHDAKKVLHDSGLNYYAIPGDRDLWWSVGPQTFLEVFETNYHSVKIDGVKFVMLDNSANYSVIDEVQMSWFKREVRDADFVLLAQPLYISEKHVYYNTEFMGIMGVVKGETVLKVKQQADEILTAIRESSVKAVVAGDHHLSSKTRDPVKNDLEHYVVGPVIGIGDTEGRLRSAQSSRFSILTIFEDGFEMEDVVLE
jgi:predicted phosphodiesterase